MGWLIALLAAALGCIAYGIFIERHAFVLRRFRAPILPADALRPITLLHLSDLHTVRSDAKKLRFMAALPPADISVITGDLLGEAEGLDTAVAGARSAKGISGSYFTLGSNDHYVGGPLNYLRYFKTYTHERRGEATVAIQRGPAPQLIAALESNGWTDLDNTRTTVDIAGVSFEVGGIDDAHIHRDDLAAIQRQEPSMIGIGVTHSPDPGPDMIAMGYDLVVAGHTHGGQVRAPIIGALVNNSALPNRYSRGLFRLGDGWFHISAGLGTSKYAPFRFLCRPEATMLELTPRPPAA